MASVVDVPALIVAVLLALAISATLIVAERGERHGRAWIAAGLLTLVLAAIGAIDILRATPRETRLITLVPAVTLPVLGALAMVRGTHRSRRWVQWPLVFLTAFVLLFGGLLIGATVASKIKFG